MKVVENSSHIEIWNKFILDGNTDALSQIYFHYYDCLFDYGLKHATDKQLVEDTIQNVFISFIKFRERIGSVKNLTGYLISAFRRQLYLDLNKQKKTIPTEQFPQEHFDYFRCPEQDLSDVENKERLYSTIEQCVSKLTDKQREIIFLRFEREIPYEEIAQILNISVESCYKSSYRSIKIIKSEVEKMMVKAGNIFLCILLK